jgi:hypothetical protein
MGQAEPHRVSSSERGARGSPEGIMAVPGLDPGLDPEIVATIHDAPAMFMNIALGQYLTPGQHPRGWPNRSRSMTAKPIVGGPTQVTP